MNHLVKRWCDQSAQSYDIHFLLTRCLKYLLTGNHYAEIYYIIIIAAKYNSYNILSDIVNITFYCRHQYLSFRLRAFFFCRFYKRQQICNCFLHYPRALYYLREKHFPFSEKITDNIHSVHQRTFDNLYRLVKKFSRLFSIFIYVFNNSFYKRMCKSGFYILLSPAVVTNLLLSFVFYSFCIIN